jgi:hypothetical protein
MQTRINPRRIEYRNELGTMVEIRDGVRYVYQDVDTDYTWFDAKINGNLVGFVDMKTGSLVMNRLPVEPEPDLIPI